MDQINTNHTSAVFLKGSELLNERIYSPSQLVEIHVIRVAIELVSERLIDRANSSKFV